MAVGQSQLERAIYDIKRGANVSQLRDDYNISTRERVIKEVKVPVIQMIPTDDVFFSKTDVGKPDVEFLKDHFFREGRIKEEHALYIIHRATQLLRAEPNVLTVDGPFTVGGGIYGQYYDLMTLFEVGGHPSITPYLFLGDYIGGGYFDIECLLYLWTLKILYPNSFFLLRGRHECRAVSKYFTFEVECKYKYSERVYKACIESFCALPLVAILDNRFFCVNGGISPELHTIEDALKLNRFRDPPTVGLMRDLLWSDPIEDFDQGRTAVGFVHTPRRGNSYVYTFQAVDDFLERNSLLSIIRAHEMHDDGYRMYRKRHGCPSVISVFSAPKYLDVHLNEAAVLKCAGKVPTVRQFNWREHPFRLPKFMDAFSWSIPSVCENVLDMLAAMLYIDFLGLKESIKNSTLSVVPVDHNKAERLEMLQNKILAVRCISYMFFILRMKTKHESELKNFLRSSGLMYCVLSLRDEDIKDAIKWFNIKCTSDENYECLPPIEGQLTSAPLPSPNTRGSVGEKGATATATAGATPMTLFWRTKEGGVSEAKQLNTEVQDRETEVRAREEASKEVVCRPERTNLSSEHFEASIRHAEASPKMPEESFIIPETSRQLDKQSGTSRHQTEPRINRAAPEIQDIGKQLQEKGRDLQIWEAEVQDVLKVARVKETGLQIREADVQDVEKVLRVKERDLQVREADVQDVEKVLRVKERDIQIREADVQKMLQAVNERREAMDLQEDNLLQRSAAMKEWEENLRLREASLTQQTTIASLRQPNGAARDSDLFSLSSISTIRNSPHIRSNVDLSPWSEAKLEQDSRYQGNELVSPASTTRGGPSMHANIGLSSSKSHARLKEDSEYYSNE